MEVSIKSSLSQNNPDVKSDFQFSSPVTSADTESKQREVVDKCLIGWYNNIYRDVRSIEDVARHTYMDFYCEIEAREASYRMNNMTKTQRKSTIPLNVEGNKAPPFTHKEYQNGNFQKNTNSVFAQNKQNGSEIQMLESTKKGNSKKIGHFAKDIPDFGVWKRSQLGNMIIKFKEM